MVTEPAASATQTLISSLSAAILAWTGLTYLSLLWSFFGVLFATVFIQPQAADAPSFQTKVFLTVFLATIAGAGLAELVHSMLIASGVVTDKASAGVHIGIALLLGAGAKPCMVAGVSRLVRVFSGEPAKGI
jgi:hypothetical protein